MPRKQDLARTRYWEARSSGEPQPSATAEHGRATSAHRELDPNDPILQAVQAAKHQLIEAERTLLRAARQLGNTQTLPAHDQLPLLAACAKQRAATTQSVPAAEHLQLLAACSTARLEITQSLPTPEHLRLLAACSPARPQRPGAPAARTVHDSRALLFKTRAHKAEPKTHRKVLATSTLTLLACALVWVVFLATSRGGDDTLQPVDTTTALE